MVWGVSVAVASTCCDVGSGWFIITGRSIVRLCVTHAKLKDRPERLRSNSNHTQRVTLPNFLSPATSWTGRVVVIFTSTRRVPRSG